MAENEENHKIGELKQITKKKKKGLFDDIPLNNKNNLNFGNALNYDRAMNFNVNNYKSHSLSNNKDSNFKFDRAPLSSQNNNINSSLGINYCMAAPTPPRARKGRPGRIASLFRLNRVKYDEMKEDGGKTEF